MSEDTHAPSSGTSRGRRIGVGLLVVLCSLGILASTLLTWAHWTLLNTSGWVATVGPLVDDPTVVAAVSAYAADEIVAALDVPGRADALLTGALAAAPGAGESAARRRELATGLLRSGARVLVVPLVAALRDGLQSVIADVMATEEFRRLWLEGNELLHRAAIQALRGETTRLQVSEGGAVTLNLYPLMDRVFQALGDTRVAESATRITVPDLSNPASPDESRAQLSDQLGIDLPEGFGQVAIVQSDQLAQLKRFVRLFDLAAWLVPLLTAVAAAAALYLSRQRLRTALWLGLGGVVAMLLLYVCIAYIDGRIAAEATGPAAPVVLALVDGLVARLSRWIGVVLLAGTAVAAAAYLVDGPAWLVRLRSPGSASMEGPAETTTS